ncbi:MAG TPA: endolytic transglycosylase MltG, partial [Rubrobacteraceae bacterium]|nr:endolytic transglycosylase MltG [Rubrobacteraceae bacterium]
MVLIVLLLVCMFYGIYLLASGGEGATSATVVVKKGDSLSSVADKLGEAGVINSPTLFKLEARLKGEATEIKPGEYRFEPGEDTGKILEKLASGDSISAFTVAIPEGLTLGQTAQEIAEQSDIPAAEFEAAANKTDYGYAFLDDPAIESTE